MSNRDAVHAALITLADDGNRRPKIREIQAVSGVASTSNIRYHLIDFERSGVIRFDRRTARGIEVIASTTLERLCRAVIESAYYWQSTDDYTVNGARMRELMDYLETRSVKENER